MYLFLGPSLRLNILAWPDYQTSLLTARRQLKPHQSTPPPTRHGTTWNDTVRHDTTQHITLFPSLIDIAMPYDFILSSFSYPSADAL